MDILYQLPLPDEICSKIFLFARKTPHSGLAREVLKNRLRVKHLNIPEKDEDELLGALITDDDVDKWMKEKKMDLVKKISKYGKIELDEDEEKHCQEWHAFFDASFLEFLIVLLISILVTLLECLIWIFYYLF